MLFPIGGIELFNQYTQEQNKTLSQITKIFFSFFIT
jgi:hypothetical protein